LPRWWPINGYFDDIEIERVLAFETALLQAINTQQAALIGSILEKRELEASGEMNYFSIFMHCLGISISQAME
jgi:F0F1-type ATP synthase alpha subunit